MKVLKYLSMALVALGFASCEKHEIQFKNEPLAADRAMIMIHYMVPQASSTQKSIYKMEVDGVTIVKGILSVLFVVGTVAGVMVLGKKWLHHMEAVLAKEMQMELTKKAVKRMNRRLYMRLRITSPEIWTIGKLTDAKYEAALCKRFSTISEEEWNKLREVAKNYTHLDLYTMIALWLEDKLSISKEETL